MTPPTIEDLSSSARLARPVEQATQAAHHVRGVADHSLRAVRVRLATASHSRNIARTTVVAVGSRSRNRSGTASATAQVLITG